MKIMAVSDLHGSLEGLDPRGADVVVVAGDLAPMKGWGVWHVNDQVKWVNQRFAERGRDSISADTSIRATTRR